MLKVTEKLWRGERPADIRDLIKQGFQRVVVLQSGAEDFLTDTLYEAQLRAKKADPTIYSEIEVIYLRCSDITPPTSAQVIVFLEIVNDGKKTFVHCHSGVDRTGFLIACYRMIKLNWTFNEAYEEWVERGRHWWYDWWHFELRSYEHRRIK